MEQSRYDELVALDRAHWVHPLYHLNDHRAPILIERGEGIYLTGADGTRYIDGLSSLWNVAVGHGRHELGQAAAEQLSRLAFNNNYVGYTNEPAIRLADKLVELCYDNMAAVYFTNSGSESNETNFKAARFYWAMQGKPTKHKIISRAESYHGNTMGAMSATGMSVFYPRFEPLVAGIIPARIDSPHECPQSAVVGTCNGCIDAIVETIEREGPDSVAAVISEPVQGAGGVYPPTTDYFARLREVCDRYDVLLIADEVITGFGRTGKWFALDHWGVQPDMVSLAKALTSAYIPMGAAVWSQRVFETISETDPSIKFMHAFTNSGHAGAAAVALRNLQIIEQEGLIENAAERGAQLLAGLQSLADLPYVGNVRGLGLMCGFDLLQDAAANSRFDPSEGMTTKLIVEARNRGLITRYRNDSLVLAPPLPISASQVDDILTIVRESVKAVTAAR